MVELLSKGLLIAIGADPTFELGVGEEHHCFPRGFPIIFKHIKLDHGFHEPFESALEAVGVVAIKTYHLAEKRSTNLVLSRREELIIGVIQQSVCKLALE